MARLLVLGGSRQAEEGLRYLKACGYDLVVCDMDENAPGFAYASDRILASVYHLEQCLPAVTAFHAHSPIDGVMCLACDVPHIVARIAEVLCLPGIPIEAADLAVDKLAMKDRFNAEQVAVPPYSKVSDTDALRACLHDWQTIVVKPVDSRGSKGVSLLDTGGNPDWAFRHAEAHSPTGRVMAEKFLSGPQVSTESLVIDGTTVTPAMSDRSYEFLERFAPFIVENGGDMPSALPDAVKSGIEGTVSRAAGALGIRNGIVKGDIVVHEGRPYVIELAARLSGGYFCTHQIPFSTGIYLVEAVARLALGEKLNPTDWMPHYHKPVSTRWLIPPEGRVKGHEGSDAVRNRSGVLAFEHWVKTGDMVGSATNAAASVAMVQATGKTRKDAIVCAETALDAFALNVEPVPQA